MCSISMHILLSLNQGLKISRLLCFIPQSRSKLQSMLFSVACCQHYLAQPQQFHCWKTRVRCLFSASIIDGIKGWQSAGLIVFLPQDICFSILESTNGVRCCSTKFGQTPLGTRMLANRPIKISPQLRKRCHTSPETSAPCRLDPKFHSPTSCPYIAGTASSHSRKRSLKRCDYQ